MIIGGILRSLAEAEQQRKMAAKLKGKVVLMRKTVLDVNDFDASLGNAVHELLNTRASHANSSAPPSSTPVRRRTTDTYKLIARACCC